MSDLRAALKDVMSVKHGPFIGRRPCQCVSHENARAALAATPEPTLDAERMQRRIEELPLWSLAKDVHARAGDTYGLLPRDVIRALHDEFEEVVLAARLHERTEPTPASPEERA